ncbi:hypothetical protein P3X46_004736 [Hevea brasiliensis]|uniref:Uncharacterized protein n=2 Tax=Hevea brasiliensis TaxID=3981 RepID=A0A6A6LVA9_HEVBR|nr:uncharacterized protein LOC110659769 [Hevea brasiliensis]KAF2305402.1 hypothetical protein GH714_004958 [Hevea brasiliensis]KAJ9185064.1 hypothetical protein P3X46_004736 [Hevea brasiliensis]
MALGLKFLLLSSLSSHSPAFIVHNSPNYKSPSNFPSPNLNKKAPSQQLTPASSNPTRSRFCISYRYNYNTQYEDEDEDCCSFDEAVALFNTREYYKCHDFLEALWIKAEDPTRTLVHGILQCAVGFHHLFNQNHKGAMMELGEGLCKLRKMNFQSGPFHQFEQDISAVLQFIYQTQIELAACTDDLCLAMDQSERSYQLLGRYGAGQLLYNIEKDPMDGSMCIVFCPRKSYASADPPRVKLPILEATKQHLVAHQP